MKKSSVLLMALVSMILSSCLKEPDLDELQYNFVVATNSDPGTHFTDYNTYYISDSVAYVSTTGIDTVLSNTSTKQLVDAVKQNMNSRGFTFVAKGTNPDLGINMGIVKSVNATTVIYPGWWWGYPGWWDPWYWGWYYPYYYPWSVTFVVTTGTVMIDIIDRKNAPSSNKLTVLWTSVMTGAVGDDLNSNVQLGVNAINQSFAQSPEVNSN